MKKQAVGDIEQPFDLPIVQDFEGRNRAFLQIQQGRSSDSLKAQYIPELKVPSFQGEH